MLRGVAALNHLDLPIRAVAGRLLQFIYSIPFLVSFAVELS